MDEQFPQALERFVDLFNREEFWASHEVLEDDWRRVGSDFYQGLIVFASAFVHAVRGNPHGIVAQFDKAEERLARYGPHYLGVDVKALLEHATYCRGIVAEAGDLPRHEWEKRIPFPRLSLQRELIRGDEPELAGGSGRERLSP